MQAPSVNSPGRPQPVPKVPPPTPWRVFVGSSAARRNVINRVENLVGLRVTEVNVTVSNVFFPQQEAEEQRQRELEQQRREQEAQQQQRVQ